MSSWDDSLRRELRESPIPDHEREHFARVRRAVREADGAGGQPAPTGTQPGPTGAQPEPLARRRREPQTATRASAGKRRTVRLAAAMALGAAAVAAVAMTWMGVPGLERSRPSVATADTVLTHVQRALASISSISGNVVEYGTVRGRPFTRKVGSFVLTSDGDYRIVQSEEGVTYTYDSRTRVARRQVMQGRRVLYSEVGRDLPDPGPFFSPWMGESQVLDRSVAAYARAVIADLDPNVPVTPVTYEGRTAWSITVPEQLAGDSNGRWAHIVVDASSGYPLVVEWSSPTEVSGTRIENLHVGGAVPRSQFNLRLNSQTRLLPMSERYRRMTLPQAAALSRRVTASRPRTGSAHHPATASNGFSPLVPAWVPQGYKLSGVTAAVNGAYMGSYPPVSPGQVASLTVVLTYRRGFDRFCVVDRWRAHNAPGSDDPFDEDSASRPAENRVRLTYGALHGATAHVVIGLPDWPHLWVTTGAERRVTVSVAGDLTRSELVLVADSLRVAHR